MYKNYNDLQIIGFLTGVIGLDLTCNEILCSCGETITLDINYNRFVEDCKCGIHLYGYIEEGNNYSFTYIKKLLFYECEIKKSKIIQKYYFNNSPIPNWVPKIRIPDNKIIGDCSKQIISRVIIEFDREYGKELFNLFK